VPSQCHLRSTPMKTSITLESRQLSRRFKTYTDKGNGSSNKGAFVPSLNGILEVTPATGRIFGKYLFFIVFFKCACNVSLYRANPVPIPLPSSFFGCRVFLHPACMPHATFVTADRVRPRCPFSKRKSLHARL